MRTKLPLNMQCEHYKFASQSLAEILHVNMKVRRLTCVHKLFLVLSTLVQAIIENMLFLEMATAHIDQIYS